MNLFRPIHLTVFSLGLITGAQAQELGFGRGQFSVTQTQFTNAPCRNAIPTMAEIHHQLDSYSGGELEDKTLAGVKLIQQPKRMLRAFADLVDRADQLRVPADCHTVICGVESIWGAELGPKLLYLRLRFGFNGSEYGKKKSRRFSVSQLDHLITALSDLPAEVDYSRGDNQAFVLTTEKDEDVAGDALSFGGVRLYEAWANFEWNTEPGKARFLQQSTVVHETGHLRGFMSPFGHSSGEWNKIYKDCAVSQYGQKNKIEDYAETFRAYRYNGAELLRHCPEKYAFMRDHVFNGIEYVPGVACQK